MFAIVACIKKIKLKKRFAHIMSVLIALCLLYVQKAGCQTEFIC